MVAATLANLLVDAGHEVDVIHCVDSYRLLARGRQDTQFSVDPRVQVHPLRSPFGPFSPISSYISGGPGLKRWTLQELLRKPYDVLHWHNPSLISGVTGFRMGSGLKICTLHEFWLICPTHHLLKFGREICRERECLTCTLHARRLPQPWRHTGLARRALRAVDRFIAPSQFVADLHRDSDLKIRPVVIPNPCPPGRIAAPRERSYYLYAGRLEPLKGLEAVLPLFKGERRLVIAGDGSAAEELRRRAAGANVTFLGMVSHDELSEWYAGAIATLVPSIAYETFGLTVVEGFRQGTPAVVSQCGGPADIVNATQGGLIYRDTSELQAILARLEGDPALARKLGEAGRNHLNLYSPQRHLAAYMDLIRDAGRGRQAVS